MKIRKIIDKRIHEIEFLKLAQLEKKLINNISNLDILIFDKNIAEIGLIKKLIKRFPKRCFVIKGHEKIKNIQNYSYLIEKILKLGVQRKTIIYSFGGGTLGDLSGFLASTILRLSLIHI